MAWYHALLRKPPAPAGRSELGAPSRPRSRPRVEEYEPRVLHSADPLGGWAASVLVELADRRVLDDAPPPVPTTAACVQTQHSQPARHEIVFIDPATPDWQALLAGIPALGDDSREVDAVLLDPARDGVAQIGAALAGRTDIAAVHIISHGGAGQLRLGAGLLDAAALEREGEGIAAWSGALTGDADLLLYGCDVAAGAAGQEFLAMLARLTGADVAASTNPTGALARGGDWVLEAATGSIETQAVVGAATAAGWNHVLALASTGEFLVNTVAADNQQTDMAARGSTGAVAMSAAGNYVVVWSGATQDGSGWGVFGQRFDSGGNRLGAEFLVNQTTADDQKWATAAMTDDGRFVVAWTSLNQDGTARSVYARLYGADGSPAGGEFRLNATASSDQWNAAVAMDAAGNFIAAWQGEGPGDDHGIFARRFDAAGNALDANDVWVSGDTSVNHRNPALAMNAGGAFVVAWDNSNGVFARRFDAAGAALGADFLAGGQDFGGTGAAVGMAADGSFVLAWQDATFLTGPTVFLRQYDAAGNGGSPMMAELRLPSDQADVSLAVAPTGAFVATWSGEGSGDSAGVYARSFDAAGNALGGAVRVNPSTAGSQGQPSVALGAAGDFVVVWNGQGAGDSNGVFARQFGAANTAPSITSNGGGASAAVTVAENTTVVTTVTATDADLPAQTLTYAISGGADAARFAIDAASGALTFAVAPDFEAPADADLDNLYEVTVTVTDGNGGSASQSLGVTVGDVGGNLTVDTIADVVDGDASSVELLLANRGADGRISLREAILAANATAGADTILLGAGSHVLALAGGNEDAAASGDLDITGDLTLIGAGAAASTVDGAGLDRVFEVAAGVTVSFRDLAITGGDAANKWGGGLYARSGAVVSLDRVAVSGNAGDTGGGIYGEGATLSLTDSSVAGNSGKWGGGLYINGGTVTLERVTISGNSASSDGGGLYHAGSGALLTARNLTVSGNGAAGAGGGIYSARDMDLTNVTIAYNSAASGGGLSSNPPGTVSLRNSIVAHNSGGDANAAPLSLGNNLDSDGSLGLAGPGDLSGIDPQLAPLADNGGATLTHALAVTSAAIHAGSAAGAPATDQRGAARLGAVDMGAYEFNPGGSVAPTITASALAIVEGQAVVLGAANLNAADPDSTPAELLWTVSGVSGGWFERVASPGVAVTGFTQDDVLNSRVRFVHDGGEAAPAYGVTVSDGLLADGPRAAAVSFTPANDAPAAAPDAYAVAEDGVLAVAAPAGVLDNDSDADGDVLGAVLVTAPFHGSLALAPDGSFSYRPDADFSGVDSFTYRAVDGALDSGVMLVSITVDPVNDAPVAAADGYTVAADGALTVPAAAGLLANDADAEGDALAAALVSAPGRGILTLDADGSFAYTPQAGFHGSDSFVYRASDGAGGTTEATVFITVLAASPPPAPTPDSPPPPPDVASPPPQVSAPTLVGTPAEASAPAVAGTPEALPTPSASADGGAGLPAIPAAAIAGKPAPTDAGAVVAAVPASPAPAPGEQDSANPCRGAETPPRPAATFAAPAAVWSAAPATADAAAPRDALALLAELSRDPAAGGPMIQRLTQAMGSGAFRQELDRLRQGMEQQGEAPHFAAASTMAASAGLSVGYVMWLLRGGLLVSGVLSSLPAWRVVDPLPVLARRRPRDTAPGEDESLEAMVARASGEPGSSDDDDEPLTGDEE